MKTNAKTLKFILVTIFLAQLAYFYPLLPETVAIHFNGTGAADNFTSKQNYLLLQIALLAFAFFFARFNGYLMNALPASLINIPHREYWLAAERRDSTFALLNNYFDWLSAAMLGLFVAINQLAIEANFRNPVVLSNSFWIVLAAFLGFIAVWMYKFMRRFNKLD